MKKHTFTIIILAMLAVTAIITVLILTLDNGDTASVVLPSAPAAEQDVSVSPGSEDTETDVVDVTVHNVQAVIASLEHSTDYFAQMTSTLTASNGKRESLISMWVRGDMTRTIITGTEIVKNILTDGSEYWIWYSDDDSAIFYGVANDRSAALAEALGGLPDYNSVLELDPESITAAGYEQFGGDFCIRVSVSEEDGAQSEYYISADNGLLAGYTRYEDGQEVFSLVNEFTEPCTNDASIFRLPN